MSRRFARYSVVSFLAFNLAFVGVLRVLMMSGNEQRAVHGEHGGHIFKAHRVVSAPIEPLEDVIGAAKPFSRALHSFESGYNNTKSLGFWDVLNKSYVDQHVPRPWIGSYQCRDVLCSEFLYERDWVQVDECMRDVEKEEGLLEISPACHFMNGTSRGGGVALISFPGSGNTWLRGLLEKATGICTGSAYCDETIWRAGSVGEGIKSSNVLVVKSHKVDGVWTNQSVNDAYWNQAAILIVRNPFDALVSYYKWKLFYTLQGGDTSHTNQISTNMFRNHSQWKMFLRRKKGHWSETIRNMTMKKSSDHPVLVVRYENMKRNRTKEVLRVLDFLGVSYSPHEVAESLLEDVTTFHRQAENFDCYTPKQWELVREEVRHLITELQGSSEGDLLGLEEYLDSG